MANFSSQPFFPIFLSVLVQVPLAVFLGHSYDQRIFLDVGYLVSEGLNPYQHHLIAVFANPVLDGFNPVVGYPPTWTLMLGVAYRTTFNLAPNLWLYNFATKIPIILGNIALAFAVWTILLRLGASEKRARFALFFLLFNPFMLLTTTSWGAFDTLIALFSVVSLYFLSQGKLAKSATLLSLGFVLKPISLPLLGLPLSQTKNWRSSLLVVAIFAGVVAALWFLPFQLFHWAVPSQFTAYFEMAGGMTIFNLAEIFIGTAFLPAGLWFLGYLWVPALLLSYLFFYQHSPKTPVETFQAGVALTLIFFLTRSWLSEPNFNLIIPLALVAFPFRKLSFVDFAFLWVLPLVFMVLNNAIAQQFFLVSPTITTTLAQVDVYFGSWRLWGRFLVALVFQVFAWKLVWGILKHRRT